MIKGRTDSERRASSYTVLVIMVCVLFLVCGALFVAIGDLKQTTLANRETGFKNRAVACQALFNSGTLVDSLPEVCRDPQVLVYMKVDVPAPVSATKDQGDRNFRLLCQILRNQGQAPNVCNGA